MIDLGNINFTETLLDSCKISKKDKTQLRSLIDSKNLPELSEYLIGLNLSRKQQEAFLLLPQLFGQPQKTIARVKDLPLTENALKAISRIEALYTALTDYGVDPASIKVDFSFTNSYSYYTDTIYKIYTADSGQVLAAGGRYDDAFGYGLAACGIALYLNEINEVIEMKQLKNTSFYSKDFAIYYNDTDRKNAFQLSDLLREMGYVVTTSEDKAFSNSNMPTDVEEVLKISDGQLEIINQRMNTFSRSTFEQFIRKVEDQYVPSSIH
jgi:ATP phosphoribosyltransferase regulatory subunit